MSAKWHPHPQQTNIVSFLINIVSIHALSLPFVPPKCNDCTLLHIPFLLSLHSLSNYPKIVNREILTFSIKVPPTVRREPFDKMASSPSTNQYYFFFDQYSVDLCTLCARIESKMQRLHTFAHTTPLIFAFPIQPSQNCDPRNFDIFDESTSVNRPWSCLQNGIPTLNKPILFLF